MLILLAISLAGCYTGSANGPSASPKAMSVEVVGVPALAPLPASIPSASVKTQGNKVVITPTPVSIDKIAQWLGAVMVLISLVSIIIPFIRGIVAWPISAAVGLVGWTLMKVAQHPIYLDIAAWSVIVVYGLYWIEHHTSSVTKIWAIILPFLNSVKAGAIWVGKKVWGALVVVWNDIKSLVKKKTPNASAPVNTPKV